jgi:hypothetical protein
MSGFKARSNSNVGIWNGHATMQYRQPMHLSLSQITAPPSFFEKAPTMQADWQEG